MQRSRHELTISIDALRLSARAFSHLHEGVFITNPDGTILQSNPCFTRLAGIEPQAAIGRPVWSVLSLESAPKDLAALDSATRAGALWTGRVANLPLALTIGAARHGDGSVRNYIGLLSPRS